MATESKTAPLTAGLQLVPETILKKKHDLDQLRAHRASQIIINPRRSRRVKDANGKDKKALKIWKPEKFLSSARSRAHNAARFQRVLKKGMQARASDKKVIKTKVVLPVEEGANNIENTNVGREVKYAANSVGAKLVFCIRIRDAFGMPTEIKKVLSKFGLRRNYEGVFIRYDTHTRKLLHQIEPWVTYGVPSKAMIADLIHRRGHGKIDGKRIPISDNTIIENAMGKETGLICVEDLVHEIHGVGKNFSAVQRFLWPFRMSPLVTKFQKDVLNFKDGGEYGDRGEEMDDFIRKLL